MQSKVEAEPPIMNFRPNRKLPSQYTERLVESDDCNVDDVLIPINTKIKEQISNVSQKNSGKQSLIVGMGVSHKRVPTGLKIGLPKFTDDQSPQSKLSIKEVPSTTFLIAEPLPKPSPKPILKPSRTQDSFFKAQQFESPRVKYPTPTGTSLNGESLKRLTFDPNSPKSIRSPPKERK